MSSELDALRSVGLSYGRLLRVPYAFTLVLVAANLAIVGFIQPYAEYAYEGLRFELRSGALGASVKVGEFTDIGRRMTLRVERSEREGTDLHGVFLRAESRDGTTLAVSAARGTFLATDDVNTILLRLADGRLVHESRHYAAPRVLSFTRYDLPIDLPAIESFRRRGNGTEELTLPELVRLASGDEARVPAERRNALRANFHFRLVEIAMMLLLPLLAVALAVPPKRSTSGLGIFLAIVLVVTYHKVNQYAEQMGALGRFDPLIALWVPFLLFAALILWMYRTLAKPGGQPIGAIERAFARIGKRVGGLVRRRGRAAAAS